MERILVSSIDQVKSIAEEILELKRLGFDTETYGKEFTDRMFSMQIALPNKKTYYINFHDYSKNTHAPSIRNDVPVMDIAEVMKVFVDVWSNESVKWFIHNAKFDLRRVSIEGYKIEGLVHCTQSQAKFLYNQHLKYSLDACLARVQRAKDDRVAKYIDEHKLTSGSGKDKKKFFHEVPFEIMFEYGCIDAEEVLWLGEYQEKEIGLTIYSINDLQFQKVALSMEEIGIHTRKEYAQQGLEYENRKKDEVAKELSEMAGEPFRNGPSWLRGIFDKYSVPYRINVKTGNPVFDKRALAEIKHPIAGKIREYRKHEKYASTYYEHFAKHDVTYSTINLSEVDTGRLSYASPNMQQVPKEEELDESIPFQVRGCFKPRSPDHFFLFIDYNQQEFRLLLDYAGEHELIRDINDNGEDVHKATAKLCGITRKQAKTVNFGLLYGMGDAELALMLGISLQEARELKRLYFSKLKKVKNLIDAILHRAKSRGYIETWVGRRLYVPTPFYDKHTGKMVRFEYVMPNHLIQGGCGDIARMAMPVLHNILKETFDSHLILQVHDELIFDIHKNDIGIVSTLVNIMENTYRPFNNMKLTCGVEHSFVSWGKRDILEGIPVL